MAFRVSYRYVQQSSKLGSWTQNFWCNTNDASQCLVQADALRIALVLGKASQVYIPSYRISTVGKFRQSTQILVPGAGPSGSSFDADYPTTKLLLRFSAVGVSTKQWQGGLVDDWIANSGRYTPTDGSNTSMSRIFAVLTSNTTNWSIYTLDPNRPIFLIKSIDPATGIVTTNVNTLPADSLVRIKGVKGLLEANAIWRITVIDNTHFSLNGWVPTTQPMTKGTPTVSQQTYVFSKIQTCSIVRSTKHNVGKYPDQLSGKAKKRTA